MRNATGRAFAAALLSVCLALPAQARDAAHADANVLEAEGTVAVYFTPWDDAESAVERALSAARADVMVQAYIFTSQRIAKALARAQDRGVRVEVLADRETAMKGSSPQLAWLISRGVPVYLEVAFAAAHNKVILVDPLLSGATIITGSYNWTHAAQSRNAENLLVLRGHRDLARRYADNWKRHRAQAVPASLGQLPVR